MRFRATLQPTSTFAKLATSLNSLDQFAYVRFDDSEIRFTVEPAKATGTKVFAVLTIDQLFETYSIQSAAESNTINLKVPLAPLVRALRSVNAASASTTSSLATASIRLTKKDNVPSLCVTLVLRTNSGGGIPTTPGNPQPTTQNPALAQDVPHQSSEGQTTGYDTAGYAVYARERETHISQDVPVKVCSADDMKSIHEPQTRDPEVHILLPPLAQLKAVSDRFTRLAGTADSTRMTGGAGPWKGRGTSAGAKPPILELAATMHGHLRLSLRTPYLNITSSWVNLTNPSLDPERFAGGEEEVARHPSTAMKARVVDEDDETGGLERGWARVRVEGRDWGRVMGVGRVAERVVACFSHESALILYVYLPSEDGADESVLTYYIDSCSV